LHVREVGGGEQDEQIPTSVSDAAEVFGGFVRVDCHEQQHASTGEDDHEVRYQRCHLREVWHDDQEPLERFSHTPTHRDEEKWAEDRVQHGERLRLDCRYKHAC
jgi:hypothetical protein